MKYFKPGAKQVDLFLNLVKHALYSKGWTCNNLTRKHLTPTHPKINRKRKSRISVEVVFNFLLKTKYDNEYCIKFTYPACLLKLIHCASIDLLACPNALYFAILCNELACVNIFTLFQNAVLLSSNLHELCFNHALLSPLRSHFYITVTSILPSLLYYRHFYITVTSILPSLLYYRHFYISVTSILPSLLHYRRFYIYRLCPDIPGHVKKIVKTI